MTEPVALSRSSSLALAVARNRVAVIEELRRLLRPASQGGDKALPFGLSALDSHLPEDGLACGALHEVVPETEGAIAAALGFIVAILARISVGSLPPYGEELGLGVERFYAGVDVSTSPPDPPPYSPPSLHSGARKRDRAGGREKVIFVMPARGLRPYGRLCGHISGHGLNSLGLDPARVILVETVHRKETLWAMAEALHSAAPAAVVGMIDRLDLKTSQKLQLAASDCGLPLLLLRPAPTLEASAAATRWRVGAAEAARDRFGMHARPRWHLQLERYRNGRLGEWVVEYDHVAHRFSLAAALADPTLSRGADDRSIRPARQS